MIDLERLAEPMTGERCRGELFSEEHREPLKAACAEDGEIWQIYANNFGPDGFDQSIDRYVSNPSNRTFVLFDGDELAGMSTSGSTRAGKCSKSAAPITGLACAAPVSTSGSRT